MPRKMPPWHHTARTLPLPEYLFLFGTILKLTDTLILKSKQTFFDFFRCSNLTLQWGSLSPPAGSDSKYINTADTSASLSPVSASVCEQRMAAWPVTSLLFCFQIHVGAVEWFLWELLFKCEYMTYRRHVARWCRMVIFCHISQPFKPAFVNRHITVIHW